jgi:hypothetical protein
MTGPTRVVHLENEYERDSAYVLRSEFRRIIRKLYDASVPFSGYTLFEERPEGEPRYLLHLNRVAIPFGGPGERIKSVRYLAIPHEPIEDALLDLVRAVWHLPDHLLSWAMTTRRSRPKSLREIRDGSSELRICGDLCNTKKHGGSRDNWSGKQPRLGVVHFDTSGCGSIEFSYTGSVKECRILTAIMAPVAYWVNVFPGSAWSKEIGPLAEPDPALAIGRLADIAAGAFHYLCHVAAEAGLFKASGAGHDVETRALRETLSGFLNAPFDRNRAPGQGLNWLVRPVEATKLVPPTPA